MKEDVWCIPLNRNQALIYAPFHGISTLVNRSMAEMIADYLENEAGTMLPDVPWAAGLRKPGNRPERHRGLPDPLFLGLIPTRSCMMQCTYCDFIPLRNHNLMSFASIRKAVDGYADLIRNINGTEWNIHFFGGEPFAAFKEVVYAVNYGRRKAAELGAAAHFEVTTNGFYSEEKCRWIAENFDTVVLSLDGFPDVQNRHRPGPGGTESFPTVCRNADIFSRGSCELIIRSCVSSENVERLPEWAAFLSRRWNAEAVCLEPMTESELSEKNGLTPPRLEAFVQNWAAARRILDKNKIRLVYSSGDISALKNSLCPMGRDAVIVDPEGRIGSCWQLSEKQEAGEMDLHFGSVSDRSMRIDENKLEKQRKSCEENRERCRGCFCYAHCAGGCMLNKERNGNFCAMTKILTLWQLLDQLGLVSRADEFLKNEKYLHWLAEGDNYRISASDFSDVPGDFSPSEPCLNVSGMPDDFHVPSMPPLPADPVCGWIRDGSRIMLVDTVNYGFTVLEGDDSLRFQLEHSGLTASEAEAVWNALQEGRK